MIVAIDSMVLIYAGLAPRVGPEGENAEDLRVRAKLLLNKHAQHTIVLTAISAAEVAVPVKPELRTAFIGKLAGYFQCHPFDVVATAIAADLWKYHKRLPKELRYSDRHILKSDLMVIASAKSAGATVFYSHDEKCRKLAARVMKSRDLPKNDPDDIFAVSDIKRGEL
jgi:predicted nucleic acid-binding protein